MLILVTYDVAINTESGQKRLRRVARQCLNYGRRVQNSVFECIINEAQFVSLKASLTKIINPKTDSILIYILGKNWRRNIVRLGCETTYDVEDTLIV